METDRGDGHTRLRMCQMLLDRAVRDSVIEHECHLRGREGRRKGRKGKEDGKQAEREMARRQEEKPQSHLGF